MPSKRLLIPALVTSAALAAAGVAAATHTASATSTSATFDASTVSVLKQVTCTIAGGDSFAGTTATYTGTATSTDPRLNGALTIHAKSVIDTTSGLGRVSGNFKIVGTTAGDHANGSFTAVVSAGQAAGLARAELQHPWSHFVATLNSGFDPGTGFATGSLGTGASNGAGVAISAGFCRRAVTHSHKK